MEKEKIDSNSTAEEFARKRMRSAITIHFVFLLMICWACSRSSDIVDNGTWTKVSTFEDSLVNTYALIDGKVYYGGFDRIFYDSVLSSRLVSDLPYLKEAEIETFEVCENSCYARDAHHVYAPLQLEFIDGDEYGGYYAVQYLIKSADPQKFKFIRNDYAVSGNHMYYEGNEIYWREDVLNNSIPITDEFITQNKYK